MAEDTKVYVLDEAKNAFQGMTKEQIMTAIENMASTGSPGDIDGGFISKILELNKEGLLRFWVGTMAEFNALEEKEEGVLHLFSDDPTVDDIEQAITDIETALDNYQAETEARLDETDSSIDAIAGTTSAASVYDENNMRSYQVHSNVLRKVGNTVTLNFRATITKTTGQSTNPTAHVGLEIPEGYRPAETAGATFIAYVETNVSLAEWVDEGHVKITSVLTLTQPRDILISNVSWQTE